MDNIFYTGLTVKDINNAGGHIRPRICYICKRKEGDISYGIIEEQETKKKYYNKPKIDLGEITKNIGQGMSAVYLVCPECAVLLGIEDELTFGNNTGE